MIRFAHFRLAAAALMLAAVTQWATAGSGGSTYSLLGLGDIRYVPGARAEGMGDAGLALLSPQYINGISPATWSRLDRVRLEGSAFYEGYNSTDGLTSRYLARMDFHGALMAIPVSRVEGIVVVMGFIPYSEVNYDTYTSALVPSEGVNPVTGVHDSLGYLIHQTGTGGITRGEIGLSWAPTRDLSFGASFNYLFGTINHAAQQIPQTSGASGGTFTDKNSLSGVDFTIGTVYTGLGSLAGALRSFSIGGMVTTRTNLRTSRVTTYDFTPGPDAIELRDTSAESTGHIGIPFAYGVGIAYQPDNRWTIVADYSAQPWAQADFYGATPYGIRNSWRFGIGAEHGGSTEMGARAFDRWSYRLGFTYAATYYEVNGQRINEWGVTGGVALPLTGESRVNVALTYGGRGTIAGSLVRDKIWRLTVALHISDVFPWFVQTEEE
ncbi:MAG TPA: hypothetical protein VMM80_03270 [Bacteroidota bacterium]|nr:hypothetical protein [Bacteroidota bacterium]